MKKKKLICFLLAIQFCIVAPISSFAWHSNGHSTAGAIAYYYLLKNNPAVLAKVLATLKLHAWNTAGHWQKTLATLPASQQDVGLFMLASTYPDDAKFAKGNADGNPTHKEWHYMDFPYVVPGSGVTGTPAKTPNAQLEIAALIAAIPSEAETADKAHDLSWIFHIIEDIHQPLHCAQMFNKDFPKGDLGGNDVEITAKVDTNLHWYWDDLVGGKGLTNWAIKGQQLFAMPKYQESQLSELTTNTTPNDWMSKESYPDAVTYAYQNGKVAGTLSSRTVLDANYQSTASTLAERRVVLSGIRLAKLLVTFYSSAPGAQATKVKKSKHA